MLLSRTPTGVLRIVRSHIGPVGGSLHISVTTVTRRHIFREPHPCSSSPLAMQTDLRSGVSANNVTHTSADPTNRDSEMDLLQRLLRGKERRTKEFLLRLHVDLSKCVTFSPAYFVSCFLTLRNTAQMHIPVAPVLNSLTKHAMLSTRTDRLDLPLTHVLACVRSLDGFVKRYVDVAELLNVLDRTFSYIRDQEPDLYRTQLQSISSSDISETIRVLGAISSSPASARAGTAAPAVHVLHALLSDLAADSGGTLHPTDLPTALLAIKETNSVQSGPNSLISAFGTLVEAIQGEFTQEIIVSAAKSVSSVSGNSHEHQLLLKHIYAKLLTLQQPISEKSISTLLYRLQSSTSDSVTMQDLLRIIATVLPSRTEVGLAPRDIGRALFGLHKMRADSDSIRAIITWLTERIQQVPSTIGFTAADISRALYGTRAMDSAEETVQTLLEALAIETRSCADELSSTQLAMGFAAVIGKGLHHDRAIERVVVALADKLDSFDEAGGQLTPGQATSIVNGISFISLEENSVRRVLAILARQVALSQGVHAQDIAGMVYAMRCWQPRPEVSTELRALLHTLSLKLAGTRSELSGKDLAKCIYGLKSMSNKTKEVQNLLSVLQLKAAQTPSSSIQPKDLGRSFYGLRYMYSSHPGFLALLDTLSSKLFESGMESRKQGIFMALCSLSSLHHGASSSSGSEAAVRNALSAIACQAQKLQEPITSYDMRNLLFCCRYISTSLPEFRKLMAVFVEGYKLSDVSIEPYGSLMNNPLSVLAQLESKNHPSQELLDMLEVVTIKLTELRERDSAQHPVQAVRLLRGAFKGIALFPSDLPIVHALVVELSEHACAIDFHGSIDDVLSILSTLTYKKDEGAATVKLLAMLRNTLLNSQLSGVDKCNVGTVCAALGGLHSTCCKTAGVMGIVSFCSEQLEGKELHVVADNITTALSGLHKMSLVNYEVRRIVTILTSLLNHCREELKPLQIVNAVKSINSMYLNLLGEAAVTTPTCLSTWMRKEEDTTVQVAEPSTNLDQKELKRLVVILARKILPSRQQFYGDKDTIEQLKMLRVLHLLNCDEINELRIALRKKGMF